MSLFSLFLRLTLTLDRRVSKPSMFRPSLFKLFDLISTECQKLLLLHPSTASSSEDRNALWAALLVSLPHGHLHLSKYPSPADASLLQTNRAHSLPTPACSRTLVASASACCVANSHPR